MELAVPSFARAPGDYSPETDRFGPADFPLRVFAVVSAPRYKVMPCGD
jgi:hypothetical protein